MIRNASIHAYDVLDEVWVHALVQTREPDGEGFTSRTSTASVQVRGTGEDDDRAWLRDALVALAETL